MSARVMKLTTSLQSMSLQVALLACLAVVACGKSDDSSGDDSTGSGGSSDGGSGNGGEGGAQGDGGAPTGSTGGSSTTDPGPLVWEFLPPIAGEMSQSASEVHLMVGLDDSIYVAAAVAGETFAGPWSVEVRRYDEADGWVLVGGEALRTDPSVVTVSAFGVAPDGNVYGCSGAVCRRDTGDGWEDWAPPATPVFRGMSQGSDGTLYLMGQTMGGALQLYRYDSGSFDAVGEELEAAASGFAGTPPIAIAPDGEVAFVAGNGDVHVLSDESWTNLGPYFPEGISSAQFPDPEYSRGGELYVGYSYDVDPGTAVNVAHLVDGSFSSPEDSPAYESNPRYIALAFDGEDQVLAAWRENLLYVSVREGDSWSPYLEEGGPEPGSLGRGTLPNIATSSAGLPVISWEAVTDDNGPAVFVARARPE